MEKSKIGSNAPCPCGSGKKYKHCCMNSPHPNSIDLLHQKLRKVHDTLANNLMSYTIEKYGSNVTYEAWQDFILGGDEEFSIDSPYNQLFFPWMLYQWIPIVNNEENEDEIETREESTIAESYAEEYVYRLSEMERKFIELTVNQPFSFYEIIECQPGKGFRLKDILTGTEVDVIENSASQKAEKAQILFGQIIQYDNVGMLMASCSMYISPLYKIDMINHRSEIKAASGIIDSETLFLWEDEIRSLYFSIHNRIFSPPHLVNTDGDPICLHELFYEIESPEAVFNKLKSLALDSEDDNLLSEAEFDNNGQLIKVEFPWLKKGNQQIKRLDSTVLGHVLIDGKQLKIDTNSKTRATIIKKKITSLLGAQAKYKTTKIQSAESIMQKAQKTSSKKEQEDISALNNRPEIKQYIEEMYSKHWQQWIYDKIPALNYKTPMEAVKDADGREMIKALLDQFEMTDRNAPLHQKQKKYIDEARKKLGL